MMKATHIRAELLAGNYDETLKKLYADDCLLEAQRARYIQAVDQFIALYGDQEAAIFSAPGRSEVGGNHTDHQHGCVLAAAINLDIIAVVSKADSMMSVVSDGLVMRPIDLHELEKKASEIGTSEALIKGCCARFKALGLQIGGFNAYMTSNVLMGSGLSSSAAFETLIGTVLSGLYNEASVDPVVIAQVGQYSENVYFDKPCGLMDQCASSVGGLVFIDFKDTEHPQVKKLAIDFSKFAHSLCIVDTKGSHADLTADYAAIPAEMKKVANYFGKSVVREVFEAEFFDELANVRKQCGDRAVLRALHFFAENRRVSEQVKALNEDDFSTFKELVKASGHSSYQYLQNVYSISDVQNQSVSIGLALSEKILGNHGVCRVHGGGFAGTIQAFVEDDYTEVYKTEIEKVFGKGSCHRLKLRSCGGVRVI